MLHAPPRLVKLRRPRTRLRCGGNTGYRNCLLWTCCPFWSCVWIRMADLVPSTSRQIGNAQSQVEDVNGAGLRLLVETSCTCRSHKQKSSNKTIGPGSLRREPNTALIFWALRRQWSPRYTIVLPLTRCCSGAGIFRIIERWCWSSQLL